MSRIENGAACRGKARIRIASGFPMFVVVFCLIIARLVVAAPDPSPMVVLIDSSGGRIDSLAVGTPDSTRRGAASAGAAARWVVLDSASLARAMEGREFTRTRRVELRLPDDVLWLPLERIFRALVRKGVGVVECVRPGTTGVRLVLATSPGIHGDVVPDSVVSFSALGVLYNRMESHRVDRSTGRALESASVLPLESPRIAPEEFDSLPGLLVSSRFAHGKNSVTHLFVARIRLSFGELCRLVAIVDSLSGGSTLLRLDRNYPRRSLGDSVSESIPAEADYVEEVVSSPDHLRLLGLGRLYFRYLGSEAGVKRLDRNIAKLLPKSDSERVVGRIEPYPGMSMESMACSGDSGSDWWVVASRHPLPDLVPGHRLELREAGIHAYVLKERPIYLALYDNGTRTGIWSFSGHFGRTLPNYRLHDIRSDAKGGIVVRLEGTMFRNGFWEVKGLEIGMRRQGNSLVVSSVVSPFTLLSGEEVRTETVVGSEVVERSVAKVSRRLARVCRLPDPAIDDDWAFDWPRLTKSAQCVALGGKVEVASRRFGEPSFVEWGWKPKVSPPAR